MLQQARDLMAQVARVLCCQCAAHRPQQGGTALLAGTCAARLGNTSEELGLQAGQSDSSASAGQPGEGQRLERLRHQLLAFGMAATALGSLPRTPAEDVTFPYSFGKPPTYCDIPAPATPAAMLQRIEELETML